MAVQITVTKWQIHPDGRVEIMTPAGGREYPSLDMIRTEVLPRLEDEEHCIAYAIAYLLARQPDGTNATPILNKRLTVDFSAASPIRVQ